MVFGQVVSRVMFRQVIVDGCLGVAFIGIFEDVGFEVVVFVVVEGSVDDVFIVLGSQQGIDVSMFRCFFDVVDIYLSLVLFFIFRNLYQFVICVYVEQLFIEWVF